MRGGARWAGPGERKGKRAGGGGLGREKEKERRIENWAAGKRKEKGWVGLKRGKR